MCKNIVYGLALEFYRFLNYVGWLSVIFHLILLNICSKLLFRQYVFIEGKLEIKLNQRVKLSQNANVDR